MSTVIQHQMLAATQRYGFPVATYNPTLGAGEAGGFRLCANCGPAGTPTDYIYVYFDRADGHLKVSKFVASAETALIDVAQNYGDGKGIIATCRPNDTRTALYLSVFYQDNTDGWELVGTEQTITDAAILAGTYHYAAGDGSGTFGVRRYTLGPELLTNGDFSAWTGDDPDGWSVAGEDGTHVITEHANGAEYLSDTATPTLFMQQTHGLADGKMALVEVDIEKTSTGGSKLLGVATHVASGEFKIPFVATTTSFIPAIVTESYIRFTRDSVNSNWIVKKLGLKEILLP